MMNDQQIDRICSNLEIEYDVISLLSLSQIMWSQFGWLYSSLVFYR